MRSIKIPLEKIIVLLGFFLSFFNRSLLTAVTVVIPLLLLFLFKVRGAIFAFIFIQLRSILNPGIFPGYEGGMASLTKWAVIFLLSGYLLVSCSAKYRGASFIKALKGIIVFSIAALVGSIAFSSYPLIAASKVISYAIPTISIMVGIYSEKGTDWIREIIRPLAILLFTSIVLYRTEVGYYRNGRGFQGFFSHPNVYGVMLAFFVAGYIYWKKAIRLKDWVVIIVALGFAVISQSRTGMFSIVIAILIYLLTCSKKRSLNIIILLGLFITTLCLIAFSDSMSFVTEVLYKGNISSIFYSRESQFEGNIERFLSSPVFGTGFNVPYYKGIRTWSFSFDAVVENGNIILALLGDTGIVGLMLFAVAYYRVYRIGRRTMPTIFFVPFAVSMGEMSFFSTNNFGILYYLFFAVYMAGGVRQQQYEKVDGDSICEVRC